MNMTNFGAFVQIAEGVEGMIHVNDMSKGKRGTGRDAEPQVGELQIKDPREVLKLGQAVKAQVVAIDPQKRQLRLGMKQLIPTGLDEYIAEHKSGDVVSGRLLDDSGDQARVELGEGIHATCRIGAQAAGKPAATPAAPAKADLSSLSSMLKDHWKGAGTRAESKPESARAGQIRSFRITRMDAAAKKIEVELA